MKQPVRPDTSVAPLRGRKGAGAAASRVEAPAPSEHSLGTTQRAEIRRLRGEIERLEGELALQHGYSDADLAERLKLESRLSQYADLYDFAAVGQATLSLKGVILEMNLTGANLVGFDRLELIGRPFVVLLDKQERSTWYWKLARFREEGAGPGTIDCHLEPRRAGAPRVLQLFLMRVASQSGPLLRVAFLDATARYEAERALRESELKYRTIVETAREGVVLTDADRRYTFANRQMAGMLDCTVEELRGKSAADFTFAGDRARLEEDRERLRRGEAVTGEIRIRREDGTDLWTRYNASPVFTEKGEYAGAFEMHTDITERHHADERLKASLEEKEVLLREIHHRVKNNLQVISSLIDLQANGLRDASLRPLFHDMRDRVRSMALVHERLYQTDDFAHIEFSEYVRSLSGDLWRAHGAEVAGLELDLALAPAVLSVETAIPCGLILNELVVNAIKHAFPGRTSGHVRVELSEGPDREVSLLVADDGVGLPEGRNWRQSASLGLRLVDLLAKQLRGSIEVASTGGSAFRLRFTPPALDAREGRRA